MSDDMIDAEVSLDEDTEATPAVDSEDEDSMDDDADDDAEDSDEEAI